MILTRLELATSRHKSYSRLVSTLCSCHWSYWRTKRESLNTELVSRGSWRRGRFVTPFSMLVQTRFALSLSWRGMLLCSICHCALALSTCESNYLTVSSSLS